ncbi:MAG: hypothetical protein ACLGSH_15665 [Acidobacteriota bacterium]
MPQPLTRPRFRKRLLRHHLPLASVCLLAFAALYFTRPYPDWVTRASFSTAYPATALLAVTLLLGPWKLLRQGNHPVSSDLRRDAGIWAGILSVAHAGIGQCVHLRGRPWLYYVYSPRERHHSLPGFPLRHDLFGWANWTGLAATLLVLALLATSNDLALRKMGTPGWKKLQRWNYAVFALVAFHGLAYQLGVEKLQKQHLGFVVTMLLCVAVTLAMQTAGIVARRRRDALRQRALA